MHLQVAISFTHTTFLFSGRMMQEFGTAVNLAGTKFITLRQCQHFGGGYETHIALRLREIEVIIVTAMPYCKGKKVT